MLNRTLGIASSPAFAFAFALTAATLGTGCANEEAPREELRSTESHLSNGGDPRIDRTGYFVDTLSPAMSAVDSFSYTIPADSICHTSEVDVDVVFRFGQITTDAMEIQSVTLTFRSSPVMASLLMGSAGGDSWGPYAPPGQTYTIDKRFRFTKGAQYVEGRIMFGQGGIDTTLGDFFTSVACQQTIPFAIIVQ